MAFKFKPAVRENVSLLMSLAGGTGSGKTFSAMELAAGIAGDKPFAVIDTEAGRALHYADRFRFDHGDLKPPFRPGNYAEAIAAADAAGYPVIVVDSASHEHAGEGGLLDWHDEVLDEMVQRRLSRDRNTPEWKAREQLTMSAWIEPKTQHKQFVQRLLQLRAHLILCFRAEEKIDIIKDEHGKTKIVPKESAVGKGGWIPVCEKNLPYEMTVSFLLMADRPGFGQPIKLQQQHRELFPLDRPISRASGEAIARWAAGGVPKKAAQREQEQACDEAPPGATSEALGSVLAGVANAETLEELAAVHRPKLSPSEAQIAKKAFTARHAEIKARASEEPPVNDYGPAVAADEAVAE